MHACVHSCLRACFRIRAHACLCLLCTLSTFSTRPVALACAKALPFPSYPPSYQGRKRHPNTKISPRIPCPNSPFLVAFNLRNSLYSGCVFSLKCRNNANTPRILKGGEGGQKKIFVSDFFGCFFSLFIIGWRCCDSLM